MNTSKVPVVAKAIVHGKVSYGVDLWTNIGKTELEKVDKVREKSARIALGINNCIRITRQQVFKDMKWDSLEVLRDKVQIRNAHKTLVTGFPNKTFDYMTKGITEVMIQSHKKAENAYSQFLTLNRTG